MSQARGIEGRRVCWPCRRGSYNLLLPYDPFSRPEIKIVARCTKITLRKIYGAGPIMWYIRHLSAGSHGERKVRPNVVSFLDRMLWGKDKSGVRGGHGVRGHRPGRAFIARLSIHEKTGLIPFQSNTPKMTISSTIVVDEYAARHRTDRYRKP